MTGHFLSGETQVAGVVGWPVSHSLSPRLHSYWLQEMGLDGAYVPLAVPPGKFLEAIDGLRLSGFRGVNVTLPHKEAAFSCSTRKTPRATAAGSANTLTFDGEDILADNSDIFGFAENLKSGGVPTVDTAMVVGAGGAARGIIYALARELKVRNLLITNRTYKRAKALVAELGPVLQPEARLVAVPWIQRSQRLDEVNLLVNGTSLGMEGQPPLELDLTRLSSAAWVTDIVYKPLMTPLLSEAQSRGCSIVDGLGMLIFQAVPGFRSWFNAEPPLNDEALMQVRNCLLEFG